MSDQLMSLSEVTQLQDGSWINGGFQAVIKSSERKLSKKTNKPFWVVQLGDATGSAEAELAMFSAPNFKEGDMVEFRGKGMKFSVTQYGNKVSVSDKTDVNVLGRSAHHEEQKERTANTEPSVNGSSPTIAGQTVGMAMKESLALVGMAHGGITGMDVLKDPLFWEDVKVVAGAIIRLSRALEAGKLSPPPWPVKAKEQPAAPQPKPAAPAPKTSPQDERQAANLVDRRGQANLDEEVPF